MRKESIHTDHEALRIERGMARRLVRWTCSSLLILGSSLLWVSCSKDNPAAMNMEGNEGTDGPGNVTLVIGSAASRAVNENPTGDEVRTLRILAYDAAADDNAAPIGHKYLDNLTGTGPFYATMDLEKRGQVKFYALVNEAGAAEANEPDITLSKNITQTDLNDYRIGRSLKQYDDNGYAIPMSSLEGTDGANRTFTIAAASTPQYVKLTVTRALSRLRLYFAKYGAEEGTVQITGVKLTQGPVSTRLTTAENATSLSDHYNGSSDITVVDGNSPVVVNTQLDDPTAKLTDENTQYIATAYMPENPYGASGKNAEGEWNGKQADADDALSKAYKLTVTYQMGTETKKKDIYLPAVERNQTINVFGLLRGADIELHIRVADWLVEEVELGEYPSYTCVPAREGEDAYSTETEYINTNSWGEKLKKAFCVKFQMTQPKGQKFTPALSGNESRFELRVYRANKDVTDEPDKWVGGSNEYHLYVVPTGEYDTTDEGHNSTFLVITTQTWSSPTDALLINRNYEWNEDEADKSDTKIKVTIKRPTT